MIPAWWSIALTVVGVLGLWLAGRRNAWGWAVGLGAQGLWLAYAIATSQWGFLLSCAAYGTVYARNLYRWRRDQAEASARPLGSPVTRSTRTAPALVSSSRW